MELFFQIIWQGVLRSDAENSRHFLQMRRMDLGLGNNLILLVNHLPGGIKINMTKSNSFRGTLLGLLLS